MSAILKVTVPRVHHWTDRLFSFINSRKQALCFSTGTSR